MTMYRLSQEADPSFRREALESYVLGGELVEVEPTDRMCDTHGRVTLLGYGVCTIGFERKEDCTMVDVVRVTKEDNDA